MLSLPKEFIFSCYRWIKPISLLAGPINPFGIVIRIGNKEGVMIRVNEGYGFMRVPTVPSHIYIKLTPSMESLEIGDVVTYEKIIKGGKGFMASGVKLQRKVKDILNELHD